jgi:hypothetical protein
MVQPTLWTGQTKAEKILNRTALVFHRNRLYVIKIVVYQNSLST